MSALSQGADPETVDRLRAAAAAHPSGGAEIDRAEEFAGRFPGWAAVAVAQAQETARLARIVEELDDRLAHDPRLADALHQILSSVTAIASASAILADGTPVGPEWQARFHRNMAEDSRRLAGAAEGLMAWLDRSDDRTARKLPPLEALGVWLDGTGHHAADLERALPPAVDTLVAGSRLGDDARALARDHLLRYRRDASAVPLAELLAALAAGYAGAVDPVPLAQRFGTDLPTMMRRLATLPPAPGGSAIGLAICDASGALTLRKDIPGLSLPRHGSTCPLLPLYQALHRPMVPVRARIEGLRPDARRYLAYAVAQPARPGSFDAPTLPEATMLVVEDDASVTAGAPIPVGPGCRVCPRTDCAARREPSIIAPGR